ncbi:hypothetical protein [Sphingomonas sp. Mn802worker]|uniref:hypothetical protein n=1 Tax=Sphingomonas sp. Mn802worker TaxID=629773 RepID=UPI0012EA0F76|nr:hypothetical protein [Sphingomonas sp. Mn802worker]
MTEFEEFFEAQARFKNLSVNEQICRIAWFLHRIKKVDRFAPRAIAEVFRSVHLAPPQVSVYLSRLATRKPPLFIYDKRGYFLEGQERKRLDDILVPNTKSAAVSKLLSGLIDQVEDGPERVFLDEAIRCYQVAAFRSSIVMTWNLAYNHLRRWVLSDGSRLGQFNEGASKRFTKSPKPLVCKTDDFDEFKESEFLDACSSGKVIQKNLEQMLREKLKRRNMAAHPSSIVILQPQADDVISDLIRNVIIELR